MRSFRRVFTLAVAAAVLVGLSGCQNHDGKNAAVYVQGRLDSCYKGTYTQEYLQLLKDGTEEDARKSYEYNIEAEAEYLLDWLGMESEEPSGEALQRARDVVKKIYSYSKYTVADGEKLRSGDIAVEVTVSPIELFDLIGEDFYGDTWSDVIRDAGITSQEELDILSDEEYEALDMEYAMAMLNEVERMIPRLTYGADQTILLQLKKDEGGLYALVETGMRRVDELIIDYESDYLE